MSGLSVHNLKMDFVERNLFSDITFDVEKGDKVGFIGANGVGKTTLFKIINGEISPTEGSVFISKDTVLGYMEQHVCNHPDRNVFDELLSVFDYLMEYERQLKTLEIKITCTLRTLPIYYLIDVLFSSYICIDCIEGTGHLMRYSIFQ